MRITMKCKTQSDFREVFNRMNAIRNEIISLFRGGAPSASKAAYLQSILIEYARERVNPRICPNCGEKVFYGDLLPRHGEGCNYCCKKAPTCMMTVIDECYEEKYFSLGDEDGTIVETKPYQR